MTDAPVRLAAIQAAPVFLDAAASTRKAVDLIGRAAAMGARLAVFGETWLPGYPLHISGPLDPAFWTASDAYLAAAITIPGAETELLCAAARDGDLDVVIGVAELDPHTRGTIYATMLAISSEGEILGRHRKLVPTRLERLTWGQGQGDDLDVYDRPYGRISALNCWEHQMLLPAYALMAQGTQFHAASWPRGDPDPVPGLPVASWPRQEILSRAFAVQGACYVVAVSVNVTEADIPDRFRSICSPLEGHSIIVDPRGEIVASSERGKESIVTADADPGLIRAAKSVSDVAGHYSRPDVFELRVRGKLV